MKIGYPCVNLSIGCTPSRTFRLRNLTEAALFDIVRSNLDCLEKTLDYNIENNLLFFRISSGLVPFASHPLNTYKWQGVFKNDLKGLGKIIKKAGFRISMHPDQFVLLNAKESKIVSSSIAELEYHADVLDLMNLDTAAKIQIHLGGAYGDKAESKNRFVKVYRQLKQKVKRRLVIENDDKSYTVKDCLEVSKKCGFPVLFDVFHHKLNSFGESVEEAMVKCSKTWKKSDGVMMVDYSSQAENARRGSHTREIDLADFEKFIKQSRNIDFDLMLEIKDKEKSALKALKALRKKI